MLTNCQAYPNPHGKCVRELLHFLAVSDNEYQRTSIELRNAQEKLKKSIDDAIFQCSEKRKLACESEQRLNEFQHNVENINAVTACFNKHIEGIQKRQKQIIEESTKCYIQYGIAKSKLKQFHYKTINYFKAFAVQSNDPLVSKNCEKDINELNQQFAKEVFYIKNCENTLDPFFQLIRKCKTDLSENFDLNEYEWIPQGKSKLVDKIAEEIKTTMRVTLRKAFAHLHILQPRNRESFLAQYLKTMERNEEIIKEKLERFTNK